MMQLKEARAELDKERGARYHAEETVAHLTRQLMAEGEAVVALRAKLEQSEEEKVGLFRGIEDKSGQVIRLEKELVSTFFVYRDSK